MSAAPAPGATAAPARLRPAFAPSPRLALLLLLTALPATMPGLLWLSLALELLIVLAAALDLLFSRRRIEAAVALEPVFALGVENTVTLRFRAFGTPLTLEVRHDLPLEFERLGAWPAVRTADETWIDASYQVRPMRRGAYALGALYARYASPLRLWRRTLTWRRSDPVRVYPNLRPARQWEIAIRQGRHLEGLKRSRVRGTGTDFESLRNYQAGDQFRAINWPATARSGKLVTTLYQVDRSQPIMLLVDAGRMMTPTVAGLTRLDHALDAALLLGTVAAERGDQIGMMLFGGEVKAYMAPKKGRGQVLSMVEALYDVAPEQVEPDYGRMISWLRARHKKRSLVVFFTDMVDPDISRGLIEHLSALSAHHLVLLVCLTDPALLAIATQEPTDSKGVYEKTAALEVMALRADTKARLQSRGVLVIDVPPEQFSTAVVNQYLLIKEQGRL